MHKLNGWTWRIESTEPHWFVAHVYCPDGSKVGVTWPRYTKKGASDEAIETIVKLTLAKEK